jgi:hypothetical protein
MSHRLRLSFGVGTRQVSKKLKLAAWLMHCTNESPARQMAKALKEELQLLTVDDLEILLTKLENQIKTEGYGDENLFEDKQECQLTTRSHLGIM